MKKYLSLVMLAMLWMAFAVNSTAQNRCVLKDGRESVGSITYSDQMTILHQDEHSVTLITQAEIVPQQKGNLPTYDLIVTFPEESFFTVYVSDGDNVLAQMNSLDGEYLKVELEEGTYYIMAEGEDYTTDRKCIWLMDDVNLIENKEIQIDFGQCQHALHTNLVDENGVRFEDLEIMDKSFGIDFFWLGGVQIVDHFVQQQVFDFMPYNEQVPYWFSDFSEKSFLNFYAGVEPGDQKSYYITFPLVRGLSGDITFSNAPEDLTLVEQRFHVVEGEGPSYYHNNLDHYMRFKSGMILNTFNRWISSYLPFDPSRPYSIYTNMRIGDPEIMQYVFDFLNPAVYESYNWEDTGSSYCDFLQPTFYLNLEGLVVREALPHIDGIDMVSLPSWYPETPAMTVMPGSKTSFYGERTPLAFYSPIAFNATSFPLGLTAILGGFYFSGEHSMERASDEDQYIKVTINGEEVFNDSLYLFNGDGNFFTPDPAPVTVEVSNRHLTANGVSKTNETRVDFNLENDDAMPPTMTFLRVLNSNGDESMQLPDLSEATLVFGCADYTCTFDMEYYTFLPGYNAKPDVEVLYSFDGVEWLPLTIDEAVDLFHEHHGNVFRADLKQLEDRALDKWVSLRFILTDEAGNTQTQTLENVFFAGSQTAVNDQPEMVHSVYPNPFTDVVKITTSKEVDGTASIQVFNLLGALVYNKELHCNGTNEFVIDGTNLTSGVYFYRISTEDGMIQGRMVKE